MSKKHTIVNKDGVEEEYAFGMDKDLQDKLKAKHDPMKQAQAIAWVEGLMGKSVFHPDGGDGDVSDNTYHDVLKDGTVLIRLLKAINKNGGKIKIPKYTKAKKIATINMQSMKDSKSRENIVQYLEACKQEFAPGLKGMKETDLFVTVDLFGNSNMDLVTDQIHCLGGKCQLIPEWSGPTLGAKVSTENKREFTEEQLKEAAKIVPLQNAGSIHIKGNRRTDNIVMSVEKSVDKSGISQQNAGGIAYDMKSGLDSIDRSGGQKSVDKSGVSQQNVGMKAVERNINLDSISRSGLGDGASSTASKFNEGSVKQEHRNKQDNLTRANN